MDELEKWINNPKNIFCADTIGAIGDIAPRVLDKENVICINASAGRTKQAFELLSRKVLDNIKEYLN